MNKVYEDHIMGFRKPALLTIIQRNGRGLCRGLPGGKVERGEVGQPL